MAKTSAIIDTFVAPPCHDAIELLYQDGDILLINKPSGLLSLSGRNPLNHDSAHQRLLSGQLQGPFAPASQRVSPFPSAALIHRLDFGTSGIMLVALHKEATALLSLQFQQRSVEKRYIAILDGQLADDSGVIDWRIDNDKIHFPRALACREGGQAALTEYQLLERLYNPDRCRVAFTPLTGRTHQLRIHSQALGHPILGCDLYHNERSQQLASRLLLHASDLAFDHPRTGERIFGHSPCPF